MSHTVLLTLGRLPKALDIARSFSAAGWRVIIAEPFAMHLCVFSRCVAKSYDVTSPNINHQAYLDDIVRIVELEDVRLVVPVSEETIHAAALWEHLGARVSLFSVQHASVLALHDKLVFAQWLNENGIDAPPTARLGTAQAQAILDDGPSVVKDRCGASGSGVVFLKQGAAMPERAGSVVQARLEGEEVSSFSIVHDGRVSATIVYRPVIRDGTVSTVFERIDQRAVEAYVAHIARLCSHTGFLSFDLMIDTDGVVRAFECNPRANSGIHFLRHEDIAAAILDPAFRPRTNAHLVMQQAYSTLTLLWGAIGNWARYKLIAKMLFRARDVSWSLRDPLPFLLMTPATWPLLKQSIFEKRSLGEAAIADIGWFEPIQKEEREDGE